MINIRIYQALSEIVVESSAYVTHDGAGASMAPQAFFIGRTFFDGSSAIDGDDVGRAVGTQLLRCAGEIAGSFGGLHQLL